MRLVRRAGRRTAKLPSLAARKAYSSSCSAASSTTSLPSWAPLTSLPLEPFPLAPLVVTARRPLPVFAPAVAAVLVAAIPLCPFRRRPGGRPPELPRSADTRADLVQPV